MQKCRPLPNADNLCFFCQDYGFELFSMFSAGGVLRIYDRFLNLMQMLTSTSSFMINHHACLWRAQSGHDTLRFKWSWDSKTVLQHMLCAPTLHRCPERNSGINYIMFLKLWAQLVTTDVIQCLKYPQLLYADDSAINHQSTRGCFDKRKDQRFSPQCLNVCNQVQAAIICHVAFHV